MKKGIDISKWQGAVDWQKLAAQHKAGQLDFVILRAGYGGATKDPLFEGYYAAARAAGIPVGAYWYAYWGSYTPRQEAQGFLRAVEGKVLEYGVWYDVEYETDIVKLSKAERTAKTLEGLRALAGSGRYVGLYASTDMLNNRMEYEKLRGYDVWAAQYGSKNTCKLPYGIWQYSSSGQVDGIQGRVDCDRAYKNYPSFVVGALAGGGTAQGGGTGNVDTVGADKPGQGGAAAGQENRLPRETHTYRVRGASQAQADKLLAFCDGLGLYTLSSVEVWQQDAHGPAALLQLAERLALDVAGVLRVGPMTRGDLVQLLQMADALGAKTCVCMDIGPVSSGDAAALKALCAQLGLGMEEVE